MEADTSRSLITIQYFVHNVQSLRQSVIRRVGNSFFGFSSESLLFKSERAIHSFKWANRWAIPLLQRTRRAMKSNSLFCLENKKGKPGWNKLIWSFLAWYWTHLISEKRSNHAKKRRQLTPPPHVGGWKCCKSCRQKIRQNTNNSAESGCQ